jgi:hypothetical protein
VVRDLAAVLGDDRIQERIVREHLQDLHHDVRLRASEPPDGRTHLYENGPHARER